MDTNYEFVSFAAKLFALFVSFSFSSFIFWVLVVDKLNPGALKMKIPQKVDDMVGNYMDNAIFYPEDSPTPIQAVTTKKPEIDNQKLQDYTDILSAIGFNKRESQSIAKSILKDDPEISQEDFLRKATQK